MAEATETGNTPAPTPAPAPAEKGDKGKTDAKYTDADLDARLKAERDKWAADAKAKADADRAKADEAAAREQGRWKELADKATAERDAERDRRVSAEAKQALHEHLAQKHPDYVALAKYILPHVEFDAATTPETLNKRIEEAAAAYVKDNPRAAKEPKGGAGAPATATGGRTAAKPKDKANGEGPKFTGAAARF